VTGANTSNRGTQAWVQYTHTNKQKNERKANFTRSKGEGATGLLRGGHWKKHGDSKRNCKRLDHFPTDCTGSTGVPQSKPSLAKERKIGTSIRKLEANDSPISRAGSPLYVYWEGGRVSEGQEIWKESGGISTYTPTNGEEKKTLRVSNPPT